MPHVAGNSGDGQASPAAGPGFQQIEPVDTRTAEAADYRVVVAEECFDWREMTAPGLRDALDLLAEALQSLADGRKAAFMDSAYDVECRPSVTLIDALLPGRRSAPRQTGACPAVVEQMPAG